MSEAGGADWLEAAVEALPVAVVVVEPGGMVSLANNRARDLLALHPGHRAPAYLLVLAEAAHGGELVWRLINVPIHGETALAEVRAASIAGRTVCTIEDLTERLRRERADREFITNAAHQLRTPITAIATAIEVLQSGAKNTADDRDRFLGHIERQTERLVRLVRAMLTLSRAERGDVGPLLGLVPLQPVLLGLVAELPAKPGIAIELDCAATAAVVADEALLTEALANLLGNALDHTDAGAVQILVREELDPPAVTIEIVDTGTGIAPAELDRVFERFQRGTSGGDGAGLGLSIAKAAIVAQGGTLELDSTLGTGTTARVRLAS
jgi:two-component system sensor histidine kinase VicK